MHPNERIMKAFCDQFTPPLRYTPTLRIANAAFGTSEPVALPNAFQVTWWDNQHSIGVVAASFEGQIHAFIEASGRGNIAEHAGKVIAKALGLFTEPGNG